MSDKKIKVCHLTSAHPRYDTRSLKRQCVSLAENGYEVWFIVNDDKPDELFEGVNIRSTGQTFNKRIKRMTKGVKAVYKIALEVNADIYQLHDPELLTIALKLKKKGKKVIFDSHECYARQITTKNYLPKMLLGVISSLYFKYESHVSKRIDGIITCCEAEPKYSFLGRSKRVTYINNLPKQSEVQMIERGKNDFSERNICYSGGITYSRGAVQLAEAANKANAVLHLAGMFESEELQTKIMSLSSNNSVVFHGYLNKPDLKELYSKCFIGMCTLLPTGQYDKMGNLPTKVYEYMGMGMPFIISDFTYNRGFLEKYRAGLLVDPENPDEIAEKINYLFDHPDEAKKMGEIGREAFEKEFNWNVEELKLLDLYKTVSEG